MNVYIVADIEGTAGVVFYEHRHAQMSRLNYELLQRNRILMTEEVNAAARGAFDGGADLVVVHDHHGSGYSLLPERLDERVELIHGRNEHTLEMNVRHPDLDGTFDALVLTGMHAKAGTRAGCTPHSLIRVEDGEGKVHELSEATMSIALAGASGVPCVFCSGDTATVNDALNLVTNMAFVITKKHYAPQLARTISPKRSREMIQAGVREGLLSVAEIEPFPIPGPCTVQVADRNPETLWPKAPNRRESFPAALADSIRNVPWYKPIEKIDDGWRWPDRPQPSETPNDTWN
jgi:D-amino peptidase